MVSKWIRRAVIVAAWFAVKLLAAGDGLASRVIVLANSRDPESVRLAEFYADQRDIPRINLIALPMPVEETISWRVFLDEVYQPVQTALYHGGWLGGTSSKQRDRLGRIRYAFTRHHVSYLVVCRGVPLRIANDSSLLDVATGRRVGRERFKDEGAVDSELSLLAQSGYEITGTIPNPFYGEDKVSALVAGTVIKVSRLDGPSYDDARRLVTSAVEAERTGLVGRAYIDLDGPHPDGDQWLRSTQQLLEELGFDGEVEATSATFGAAARFDAPALYFGWYANNLNGPFAREDFRFPPGAIALHVHSFSARTLHSKTQGWSGPFVARGVTATVGNVFEPYLQLTHRPDLLLRALKQGKNFGDAAYFALPELSWQAIAIGDPLYRPFKVTLEQQEKHLDRLPSDMRQYVLLRRAVLLVREQKIGEAWNLLRTELRERPSLVLALACGRLAAQNKDLPAAVEAMNSWAQPAEFRVEDWALAHELAGRLAICGDRPSALKVYAKLVKTTAPTPAAQRELLGEARAVAEAAEDSVSAQEFARLLTELPSESPSK